MGCAFLYPYPDNIVGKMEKKLKEEGYLCNSSWPDKVHIPFISKHTIYEVNVSLGCFDCDFCKVAVLGKDSILVIKDVESFNEVLKAESLSVKNTEKAYEIVKSFLKDFRMPKCYKFLILNSTKEIPGFSEKSFNDEQKKYEKILEAPDSLGIFYSFKKASKDDFEQEYVINRKLLINTKNILPPVITKKDNFYLIELYTWEEIFGKLTYYKWKVSSDGTMELLEKIEARGIGKVVIPPQI
jgi:hypothetical protein